MTEQSITGVEVDGPAEEGFDAILTADALSFLAGLQREFNPRRKWLLSRRAERQAELDSGAILDFLPGTETVRKGDWKVAPAPVDLRDRRVEITGPTDRKMVINALNSGARGFMADFEDSNSPTWHNMIGGHLNLIDAIDGSIEFTGPDGKAYRLGEEVSTLLVRPRGWHLPEKHIRIDGEAVAGALCDFGLFVFHNARRLIDKGSGPYLYLAKMESHLEARLWNDIFNFSQDALGVPRGTFKATVLIETVPAAFEMEEILYELRDHSAGLNAGRWDYMFSMIK
ncbi:MAG: malate synthase A, partial [Actinobacteria bacterium]|nr:malate synthase A [Actinomycetota bacterium]